MTGGGDEDDPKVLFNPTLRNDSDTDYLYKHVVSQGVGIFNFSGQWHGNYNQIRPQDGFWVYTTKTHTMGFEGTALDEDLTYNIAPGNNLISYPLTTTRPFGSGGYAEPEELYGMNSNLLEGSGHADECIERIQTFNLYMDYLSGGASAPIWEGNISNFEPGTGYWIRSGNTSTLSSKKIWKQAVTAWIEPDVKTTPALTDNNYSMNYPDFSTPIYGSNNFLIFSGVKIKSKTGTVLYEAQAISNPTEGQADFVSSSSGSGYYFGFFVDELFNDNSNYPMYGCRGGIIPPSSGQVTTLYSQAYDDANPGLSVHVGGNEPDSSIKTVYGTSTNLVTINCTQLSDYHNTVDGVAVCLAENTDIPLGDGFFYKGFDGNKSTIVPVLYSNGDTRYYYMKYYPTIHDKQRPFQSDGDFTEDDYIYNDYEYADIFYDENGDFKFDPTLGSPYIEVSTGYKFPYKFRYGVMYDLYGIFQAL